LKVHHAKVLEVYQVLIIVNRVNVQNVRLVLVLKDVPTPVQYVKNLVALLVMVALIKESVKNVLDVEIVQRVVKIAEQIVREILTRVWMVNVNAGKVENLVKEHRIHALTDNVIVELDRNAILLKNVLMGNVKISVVM